MNTTSNLRSQFKRKVMRTLKDARRLDDDSLLHDIERERQRQALTSTALFVDEYLCDVEPEIGLNAASAQLSLLRRAVDMAPRGLIVEFGVATGSTLREIAARRPPAHGFDSFKGLPEHWRAGFGMGTFAQALPDVAGAKLHVGLFEDTLPAFLGEHHDAFAFVHMDADLYSSTKAVFDLGKDRFVPGSLILFDEYFNYPGWQRHEHRAFREFIETNGRQFRYIGYNPLHEQVLVEITG